MSPDVQTKPIETTIPSSASVTPWLRVRDLIPSRSNANAAIGLYMPATTATTAWVRAQARIRSENVDASAIVMDGATAAGFALPSAAARCGAFQVAALLAFDEIRFETAVSESGAAVAQGANRVLVLLPRAL